MNPLRELSTLFLAIDEFRKLDPELPSQTVATFLYVCAHEGTALKEIGAALGMAKSTTSRNVAALSRMHRLGKPGLDLITAREDPAERRRKMVTLTPRGRKLKADLLEIVRKGVRP